MARKKKACRRHTRAERKWLSSFEGKNLLRAYMRKFHVSEAAAYERLQALGCDDQLRIEEFERRGVEWEYKWDPLGDDLVVVRKGTSEWEMYG